MGNVDGALGHFACASLRAVVPDDRVSRSIAYCEVSWRRPSRAGRRQSPAFRNTPPSRAAYLVNRVLEVEPRSSVDQELDDIEVAGGNRLVERGRVAMCAWRIETVRILTGIEQHADDPGVPELSGERSAR